MRQPRQVVVLGATGQQGGAVARALRDRGIPVRALVRTPEAPAAERLRSWGVEVWAGSWEDPASLDRVLAGADALFGITTPFEGIAAEVRHGIAWVEAARRAGISHVVYASAAHTDESTGIPSFESKRKVEQHLRDSGVPFTLVGPVYFMENLLTPFALTRLREGQYVRWMPPEKTVQLITVEDIGRFCASVFAHREDFLGRRVDIAGDALNAPLLAAILSRLLGRTVQPVSLPLESFPVEGELGRNVAATLAWMARTGFHVDIPALRRQYPEVGWRTFAQWAEAQDWGELSR
ncbi:NmrA/HSCARG family protein [Hyalangium rubrum]|uniref:NmrA/HSCARG family protein n=1 Tax=Hyalangium rubrum TaxID=3103134 RepID=A0ABU5HHB8_9BACT|nr:NmrA/HSCARG family protein [Hyalangium sp. s54d21]MDY7232650.1 NmrA/HSCARG family protein [Hyalangium sp. s54d21]